MIINSEATAQHNGVTSLRCILIVINGKTSGIFTQKGSPLDSLVSSIMFHMYNVRIMEVVYDFLTMKKNACMTK